MKASRAAALVLVTALLGPPPSAATRPTDGEELARQEARLDALRSKIAALGAELGRHEGARDRGRRDLEALERRQRDVAERLERTGEDLRRTRRETAALERRHREAAGRLRLHREEIRRLARSQFIAGREQYVKLVLSQRDPFVAGRMLTYQRYFARHRAERLDALAGDLMELERAERRLTAEDQRLRGLEQRLERDRLDLDRLRVSRQALLEELERSITSTSDEITTLSEDARRLQSLVGEISDVLRAGPAAGRDAPRPFAAMRGRLAMPVSARITGVYGRPKPRSGLPWEGVFLNADEGEDVRAVHDGRIAYADWFRGFGLLLIIDHGDGYMSLYGHNKALHKSIGDAVSANEPIASVGSTGGLTRPGLYFEIRHEGAPLDPLGWCRRS